MKSLNDYVGLQYAANGRKGKYDCYGLIKLVYKEQLGITLPDWKSKDGTFKSQTIAIKKRVNFSLNESFVKQVDVPKDFNIVMAYLDKFCCHIGMYYKGRVLHINASTSGAVFERLEEFTKNYNKIRFFRWQR